MSEFHYRTCNLCEAVCGIEIEHADGEILAIKGDKNDPFSRGHICPKAFALKDIYEVLRATQKSFRWGRQARRMSPLPA